MSNWIGRVGEGLVVGITGAAAFMIFTNMIEAKNELNQARGYLELQFEVNQELVDRTDRLEGEVEYLNSTIALLNAERSDDGDNAPSEFGYFEPSAGSSPETVTPTSSLETLSNTNLGREMELIQPARSKTDLQQVIEQQRSIFNDKK